MIKMIPSANTVLVAGAAFTASAFVFSNGQMLGAAMRMVQSGPDLSYRIAAVAPEGPELVMVYLGSPTCHWSNVDGMAQIIKKTKIELQRRAAAEGSGFSAIGIAKSRDAKAGLDHLHKFGAFNEVMSGSGWLNTGIVRFVYDEYPGPAATPQLIILARSVRFGVDKGFDHERVLLRLVGYAQISKWVAEDLPIQSQLWN